MLLSHTLKNLCGAIKPGQNLLRVFFFLCLCGKDVEISGEWVVIGKALGWRTGSAFTRLKNLCYPTLFKKN